MIFKVIASTHNLPSPNPLTALVMVVAIIDKREETPRMAGRLLLLIAFLIFVSQTSASQDLSPREQAQQFVDQGLALNDNSDAEAESYLLAIEADPSYPSPHFNLGFLYQSRGELEKAIEPYSRCIELDRRRADAHRNLAVCLLAVRRDAALYEVRHHLNLAIEIQEELPPERRPTSLGQMRSELLDVERRIHVVLKPSPREHYSAAEIIHILSRPVTRGGMSVYDGPRLPLMLFDVNQVEIPSATGPQLRALAQAIESHELAPCFFIIEGHADGRGMVGHNLEISKKRAEVVRDWLTRHGGVDSARLSVEYYGEDHPIFPNDSPQNYRYNRRIEIVRRFVP